MSGSTQLAARALIGAFAAGLVVTGTATAQRPARPGPDQGVYTLALAGALPGDRPLRIYLHRRGGAFAHAIGTAQTFNQAPHDVDASGLKLTDTKLVGEVKVTIRPDSWTPKDHKSVACSYAIQAAVRGAEITGTFRGTYGTEKISGAVSGKRRAGSALPQAARFELVLERGISRTSTHWGNRAYIGFTIQDGKPVAPKVACPNNTTYADFTCRVDGIDWKLTDGKLTCTIRAAVAGQGRYQSGGYTFSLTGRVIGEAVAGTFTTRRGEAEVAGGRFVGTVEPAAIPSPADCIYELHLHQAARDGKAVWVHLDCTDGTFRRGLAFAPQFNHVVHDVDGSGLRIADGRLLGALRVTIHPDPYVPKDRRPIACTYDIEADLKGGGITGRLKGTFGPTPVQGRLAGLLVPRPALGRSLRIWLKMEQGVTGGNPWSNRTYVNVTLRDGQTTAGRFFNNKGAWNGTLDRANLKIDADALTGTVTATVVSGRVRKGTYTFRLNGRLIGRHITGTFTSTLGRRIVQSGRFAGGVQPAE